MVLCCTDSSSLPNDLQHWNPKGHSSNAVSLILDLLFEAFLVSIYKFLQLSLKRLSKMLLTLLHHTAGLAPLRTMFTKDPEIPAIQTSMRQMTTTNVAGVCITATSYGD